MNVVYCCLTFNIPVLKTRLAQADKIRGLETDIPSIYDDYELEDLLAPRYEICVMALNIQSICVEYGLRTLHAPT